jgi:hypothetical protein
VRPCEIVSEIRGANVRFHTLKSLSWWERLVPERLLSLHSFCMRTDTVHSA